MAVSYKRLQHLLIERDISNADLMKQASYDKDSFEAKTNLLLNHFIDMAIQGYGWIAA